MGRSLRRPPACSIASPDTLRAVEEEHDGDVEATTKTFYDLLTDLRFFPNSPTFTGAGTPLGQLGRLLRAAHRR